MKAKLTEVEFTRQVLELAKLCSWKTAHFRPAKTAKGWRTPVQGDGKGFPDLVLVRDNTLIFAELKVGKNKPSPEQEDWLARVNKTGAIGVVWTPDRWREIEELLRFAS